jgi:hypothetical protein
VQPAIEIPNVRSAPFWHTVRCLPQFEERLEKLLSKSSKITYSKTSIKYDSLSSIVEF